MIVVKDVMMQLKKGFSHEMKPDAMFRIAWVL